MDKPLGGAANPIPASSLPAQNRRQRREIGSRSVRRRRRAAATALPEPEDRRSNPGPAEEFLERVPRVGDPVALP